MGRLTFSKDGEWGLVNGDVKNVPTEIYGALCKLKDYENTGLSPDQIYQIDTMYEDKCKEVALLKKEYGSSEGKI